ncbi:divergent polysaccharide deacetylase family protein [Proteus myxofaciens]|nr:divergent polysaccharide deacetylase family protein [Proteus myxofaciens]
MTLLGTLQRKVSFILSVTLLSIVMSTPAFAAKLAIVIDDFGYRKKEDNQILQLPTPISIAILPDSPHGKEAAIKAHAQGREILIHMPMLPISKQPLEQNTLKPSMGQEEIDRIIQHAISNVPYAVGMNNHMGSAMTSDRQAMDRVIKALNHSHLYFLDSVTIGNTQAAIAAQAAGVPSLRRHVFLDNVQTEAETRQQLNRAIALARKNGSAIAIGHPHPSTVRALQQQLPLLPADIELVAPSVLLKPLSTTPKEPIKPKVEAEKEQPKTQKPASWLKPAQKAIISIKESTLLNVLSNKGKEHQPNDHSFENGNTHSVEIMTNEAELK